MQPLKMPAPFKLFDAHFHIIDGRFPLVSNHGYLPEPFTTRDYLDRMQRYLLGGGALVSGSFQALDQTYLIDALHRLGPAFVGITQLPVKVSDDQILYLNKEGIRGVRFNLKRGGSEKLEHLDRMARRIHEMAGWHVELYIDSRDLAAIYPILVKLPAVSIAHLGLSLEGFKTLVQLAEQGVRIKATGFGRIDFDVPTALRTLHTANPEALLFGTDLPSTRANRPYEDNDYTLIIETLGEEQASRVLYENAISFYRPPNRG